MWEFILHERLEYCELYDQGYKRIGCIGCPMQTSKNKKRDFARYPNFKKAYLHAMQKNMDTRKTPSKFENVDKWFNWWVNDKRIVSDKSDLFSHFE
jgi:phosphoadenosine phosphosulfate reductase